MSYSVHIVTTPTADTPGTTFVVRTQKKQYVFGSFSEGTQRAMVQMGTRLIKVQDFFLTGKMDWCNTGGLLGLTLTLADSASSSYATSMEAWKMSKGRKKTLEPQPPKLNMYGPPNLNHTLSTARRFIFRKGIPTSATEYRDVPPAKDEKGHILPSFQDEYINVWALPVSPLQQVLNAEEEAALAQKKKNYDAFFNTFEEFQAPENESSEDRESRYQRIRQVVVDYMFNSNWNFDTLIEQHISEVAFPATLFVRNPVTHHIEPYRGPKPGGNEPLPDIKVLTRTPWPGAKVAALPPTKPALESISYILRTNKLRGTFDAKRAKELGIKPGPLFGRLSNGESIPNDKGEMITPEMVMGPEKPGQGFAILDVPSINYLESLIQREELQSEHIMDGIKACFWILGPGVHGHPTLQQFMKKLNQVEHIVSSVDTCPNDLAFESVAEQTGRLAKIDPARYTIPYSDKESLPQKTLVGLRSARKNGTIEDGTKAAERGLAYDIMPVFKKRDSVPSVMTEFDDRVMSRMDADVLESAEEARNAVRTDQQALITWRNLLARPDTEVITLGTGSALPSKYRNVSATLLRVPGVGNYLFDCGENTLGQLQRVFNAQEFEEVIRDLRVIWISHLHADHHLGTVSVIKAWYELKHGSVPKPKPPFMPKIADDVSNYGLSVISHEGMLKWLWEYSSVEDFGYSRILPLSIQPVLPTDPTSRSRLVLEGYGRKQDDEGVLEQQHYNSVLGLVDIQSCNVRHCNGSMAVSLTFPRSESDPEDLNPLKVSYSGDCRPSQNFAHIGRDSTVLIHEATFDDELSGDAKAKKHSTTSEALGIGSQMDAKAVVLTHFSQRYQKIPILETVQDSDQVDDKQEPDPMEDVQEEPAEEEDDGPADNMDVHSSAATVTATPLGGVSSRTSEPKSHEHAQVIKVRSKHMKVAVAFDYMRVKIGEIAQLEKFNDALNKLLVKEEEIGDEDNDAEEPVINANGKKTSGDEGGTEKKNKKSKRNN
ncbi:ribonuclease Z mitochondrial precursor [Periconia macrospinosa]|uniref:ribonuclease Z n=1 Tax=Periconia macrospinosa TaxID=97972 RepID=A0A2V1DP19_9PLEO|nr:ribonuclease Z mitochondrial precursor [Periconia macrospinosa]